MPNSAIDSTGTRREVGVPARRTKVLLACVEKGVMNSLYGRRPNRNQDSCCSVSCHGIPSLQTKLPSCPRRYTARLRSQTVGFLSQETTTKVLLSFRANPTMLQADTDSYVGNASLEEVPFSRSHVDPSRFSALLPRTSESNESKNCFASGSESGETNG